MSDGEAPMGKALCGGLAALMLTALGASAAEIAEWAAVVKTAGATI